MQTHAGAQAYKRCLHQRGIHEPAAASDHFPSWIGSKGALLCCLPTSCPLRHPMNLILILILKLKMSRKTTQSIWNQYSICISPLLLCVSWIIGELSARIAWGWSALYRAKQQIWSVGSVLGPLAYMDKKLALFPCQWQILACMASQERQSVLVWQLFMMRLLLKIFFGIS